MTGLAKHGGFVGLPRHITYNAKAQSVSCDECHAFRRIGGLTLAETENAMGAFTVEHLHHIAHQLYREEKKLG